MQPLRRPLALFSSLALGGLSWGQSGPFFASGAADETDLNGAVGLSVGATAFGDFDGDLRADLTLVSEGALVLADGIVHFRSLDEILDASHGVHDVVTVRSQAAGGWDLIALVDAQGLSEIEILSDHTVLERSLDDGPLWADAQRVLQADIDADGTLDYVGLDADLDRILLHDRGSGMSSSILLPADADPEALAVLNWSSPASGTDELEIAVGMPTFRDPCLRA